MNVKWPGRGRQSRVSPPPAAPPRVPPGTAEPPDTFLEDQGVAGRRVPVREVRIAVTMVGGTSLAIYESGVAQELWRMVCGQGVYGLAKRLTHSHAYVDILSGTSAGGINTICLSAALANGTDLGTMHDVWVRLGGIDALLQDPHDRRATALLRGNDYYLRQLTAAFGGLIDPARPPRWPADGIPSGQIADMNGDGRPDYTDLDLFVTGTYYEGQPRAFYDSRTRPIFTHDYAGVFHVKHRPRRGESHLDPRVSDPSLVPLAPGVSPDQAAWPGADPRAQYARRWSGVRDRLARIARTTSSLPAVFEPSEVHRDLMNGVIDLPPSRNVNYLLDGGFLNNRPLDLVLAAIYERPAQQEVLRKVLFVEPVAEELEPPAASEPLPPTALQSVWFYKDVPGRQSLSAALEGIYRHNVRARRVGDTLVAARRSLAQGAAPSEQQRRLWADICLQDWRDRIVRGWEAALGVQGFGGVEPAAESPQAEYERRRATAAGIETVASGLYKRLLESCADLAPGGEGTFHLAAVDASALARRIDRATQEIYQALYPSTVRRRTQHLRQALLGELGPDYERLKAVLLALSRLRDLTEIVVRNLDLVLGATALSPQYARAGGGGQRRGHRRAVGRPGRRRARSAAAGSGHARPGGPAPAVRTAGRRLQQRDGRALPADRRRAGGRQPAGCARK